MRRKAFAKADGSHIPPAGYDAINAYADAPARRAPEAGRDPLTVA